MESTIARMPARCLRAGMVMAFRNPRFNYRIESVEGGSKYDPNAEVKVVSGNGTLVEWYGSNEVVWVDTDGVPA